MNFYTEGHREDGYWNSGEQPWFFKSWSEFGTPDPDGNLFCRNGQQVTIVERMQEREYPASLQERFMNLELVPYRVRFADGAERIVLESELYDSPSSLLNPKHLFD